MIKALFKYSQRLINYTTIDTTSSSGQYKDLSPFILPAPPARRFENLWQYSKVYKWQLNSEGEPDEAWHRWREHGFNLSGAVRYPMGKGAIPEYSYWNGGKIGYIEARKRIYAPIYAENVIKTDGYKFLEVLYGDKRNIVLLDYDAYDHQELGMSLVDVINNPERKMGHAFVLIMMLTGMLEECINSK